MTLTEAVVKRLKALMEERGFTQFDFYTKGGVPKATVSQILNGNRKKNIAISSLYKMTSTRGISLGEFFSDPVFDEVTD